MTQAPQPHELVAAAMRRRAARIMRDLQDMHPDTHLSDGFRQVMVFMADQFSGLADDIDGASMPPGFMERIEADRLSHLGARIGPEEALHRLHCRDDRCSLGCDCYCHKEMRAPGDMTPQDVYEELEKLCQADVIEYVLPTEPLGDDWVVGIPGLGLVKFSQNQAIAFLTGASALTRRLIEAKEGRR